MFLGLEFKRKTIFLIFLQMIPLILTSKPSPGKSYLAKMVFFKRINKAHEQALAVALCGYY